MNEEKYDKIHFLNKCITHNDLFFVDGSNPPDKIVKDFFTVVEVHLSNPSNGREVTLRINMKKTEL